MNPSVFLLIDVKIRTKPLISGVDKAANPDLPVKMAVKAMCLCVFVSLLFVIQGRWFSAWLWHLISFQFCVADIRIFFFGSSCFSKAFVKINVMSIWIAPVHKTSKVLRYSTHCQGISQFYLHTLRFIRKRNEPYLPLPSQPQLVLIYRPPRDGRLSRPWYEVALAEIRSCNLPITSILPRSH